MRVDEITKILQYGVLCNNTCNRPAYGDRMTPSAVIMLWHTFILFALKYVGKLQLLSLLPPMHLICWYSTNSQALYLLETSDKSHETYYIS